MNSLVVAATDGSAINNPHGPAGWAWFVSENCWAAGGFNKASNQVAELFAVLALLRAVPREYDLLVRTDSQFTINALTKWIRGWKRNDWRKADGTPVANLSLIQDLDRALAGRRVEFEWVRGHSGDPMNEVADRICSAASSAVQRGEELLRGPGWTGFSEAPVIPRVGRRPAPRTAQSTQGGSSSPRRPSGPAKLVGARITEADLKAQGYGANASIKRVTAQTPSSPARQKFEICGSCDGPIHPLTLNCRCGSM